MIQEDVAIEQKMQLLSQKLCTQSYLSMFPVTSLQWQGFSLFQHRVRIILAQLLTLI